MAGNADRRLVLLRHAKSDWPDVADHERPLSARGRRDAPVVGHWLRNAGYVPDRVICSTALRARQTWQAVAATLGTTPPEDFEPAAYGASASGLLALTRQAPPAVQTLLLVGHNPAIAGLALMLAGDGTGGRASPAGRDAGAPGRGAAAGGPAAGAPPGLERVRSKFPTAAVAVLEFPGAWERLAPGRARLATFVTPHDLRSQPS